MLCARACGNKFVRPFLPPLPYHHTPIDFEFPKRPFEKKKAVVWRSYQGSFMV